MFAHIQPTIQLTNFAKVFACDSYGLMVKIPHLRTEFVDTCIMQFASHLLPHTDMVHELMPIMDRLDLYLISSADLRDWNIIGPDFSASQLVHFGGKLHSNYEAISDYDFKITVNLLRQIIQQQCSAEVLPWIDAIHAGCSMLTALSA